MKITGFCYFNFLVFAVQIRQHLHKCPVTISFLSERNELFSASEKLLKNQKQVVGRSLLKRYTQHEYAQNDGFFSNLVKEINSAGVLEKLFQASTYLLLIINVLSFYGSNMILDRFWSSTNCFGWVQFILVGSKSFWTGPSYEELVV